MHNIQVNGQEKERAEKLGQCWFGHFTTLREQSAAPPFRTTGVTAVAAEMKWKLEPHNKANPFIDLTGIIVSNLKPNKVQEADLIQSWY